MKLLLSFSIVLVNFLLPVVSAQENDPLLLEAKNTFEEFYGEYTEYMTSYENGLIHGGKNDPEEYIRRRIISKYFATSFDPTMPCYEQDGNYDYICFMSYTRSQFTPKSVAVPYAITQIDWLDRKNGKVGIWLKIGECAWTKDDFRDVYNGMGSNQIEHYLLSLKKESGQWKIRSAKWLMTYGQVIEKNGGIKFFKDSAKNGHMEFGSVGECH